MRNSAGARERPPSGLMGGGLNPDIQAGLRDSMKQGAEAAGSRAKRHQEAGRRDGEQPGAVTASCRSRNRKKPDAETATRRAYRRQGERRDGKNPGAEASQSPAQRRQEARR